MALTKITNKKTPCKPNSCPTCGSVECFERPRYFCGQLLTDRDLDAGQRYVIEKNKLHNRYLFGSGVVCGLAVRCDPCPGIINVEPGYAIDCCGNDIVACEPKLFDVNEYIDKCLTPEDRKCEEKIKRLPSRCDEKPGEYFLVISFSEEPAKPVTALNRDNGCNTSRCEPSRTKETFRLDLITGETLRREGEAQNFWSRGLKCLYMIFPVATGKSRNKIVYLDGTQRTLVFWDDILQALGDHDKLLNVFCAMKQYIIKMYEDGPNVRCGIDDELEEIERDFPASMHTTQYWVKIFSVFIRMYGLLMQLFKDCLCEAMLVPCSSCTDEQVLLASVTVKNRKVTKICNNVRKQVLTGPAFRYWMYPIIQGIGEAIDKVCCSFDIAALFEKHFDIKTREDFFIPMLDEKKVYIKKKASGADAAKETDEREAAAVRTAFNRFGAMVHTTNMYALAYLGKINDSPILQPQNLVEKATAQLETVQMDHFFDQENIIAADITGQQVNDITERLRKSGMTVEVKDETAETLGAKTFEDLIRKVPAKSKVTLYKDSNNTVTGFRIE